MKRAVTLSNGELEKPRALVVMAKPPRIGEVKTRLCPPLTPGQASDLHECLLQDTVAKMERCLSAQLWIAFTPEGEEYFRRTFGERKKLLSQRGRDLGERMHHIFVDLSLLGYRDIVVLGSDIPTMPLSHVEQAFHMLSTDGEEVVLGPANDGGYYLIGLKTPVEEIFRRIPWSNAAVLQSTVQRIKGLGLRLALLPLAYDIDLEGDLKRLWNDFETSPGLREDVPKTYAFLVDLFGNRGNVRLE
jgi:rSAM/selenodomain-associated transferase 1